MIGRRGELPANVKHIAPALLGRRAFTLGHQSRGANTSTAHVNLRSSPGCSEPTPTRWRPISPRSFVIVTTTAYSPRLAGARMTNRGLHAQWR